MRLSFSIAPNIEGILYVRPFGNFVIWYIEEALINDRFLSELELSALRTLHREQFEWIVRQSTNLSDVWVC